jgi:HEAT repeat protein
MTRTLVLLLVVATPLHAQTIKPDPNKTLFDGAKQKPPTVKLDDTTKALVGVLTKQLKDKDPRKRADAAEELGRLGTAARDAARPLCELCSDGSTRAARAAIDAIEKIRPDLHRHLVAVVVEQDDRRRDVAFSALAALKDEANPATPLVLRYVRVKAAQFAASDSCPAGAFTCLTAIAADDPAIYSPLVGIIRQYPNSALAGGCLKTLTRLADNRNEFAGKLTPYLISALSGPNKLTAIRCLGSLGPYARDALPQLRKFRFDGSEEIRTAASEALRLVEDR